MPKDYQELIQDVLKATTEMEVALLAYTTAVEDDHLPGAEYLTYVQELITRLGNFVAASADNRGSETILTLEEVNISAVRLSLLGMLLLKSFGESDAT